MRVNVGLSRKISRDYQSTGYSVAIEGEILAPPEQGENVLKQIHALYLLAENALDREIDRDQGEQAIGRRDEETAPSSNGHANGKPAPRSEPQTRQQGNENRQNGHDEGATNKQVQFMLNLGKRQGMSKVQLESWIEEFLGQKVPVYELKKKDASRIIEALNQQAPTNGRR